MMQLIGQFGFDDKAFPAILPLDLIDIIHHCLRTGAPRSGLLTTRDGYSYEWTFFPVPHTSLVRGYGVNLTERLHMEDELRQAKEAAEAANRVKSEFLATVSHELRTPLNGVMGMVDLLLGTLLTAEQQEYTEIARRSATDLLNLVNDILDVSQIGAGKLQLDYSDFSLPDMVRNTLALFVPQACKKKLELRCELASDIPCFVHGDFTHLQQVLVNLISNAVKFTERGEIIVEVKSQKSKVNSPGTDAQTLDLELGTCDILFSVRDTGIGIPENRQGRLFQAFSQIDASHTRKYSGAGLGLALSKQLVELMGGSMGVESKVDQGSVFWFTVPLESRPLQQPFETARATPRETVEPHNEDKHSLPAPGSLPPGSIRLLLVEDNLINQKLAVRLLKKFGYEVDVAGNGREALTILSEHSYEAILMDCQMPEMDGFAATKEIRRREAQVAVLHSQLSSAQAPAANQHPAPVHVPIIALTANAVQGDKEQCLAAGMDDYITKPINPTELKEALDRWLSPRSTDRPHE
jgi:signal transduction histidine kinase/FixJ family two-component response regulator